MKRILQISGSWCDITAVVLDVQPVRSVKTRSGECIDCCVLFLGDPSLQYVQLSMWRDHAFEAAAKIAIGDVVAVKRVRKSEFLGSVSLNGGAQTWVKLLCRNDGSASHHADDEATRALLHWAKLTFPAITRKLQTCAAWQCTSFRDFSHAALLSVAATIVSSEEVVDDYGNHAYLVISDPVRHRNIMLEVLHRVGVRFHWRNLLCEQRDGAGWRLHVTAHTTAEVMSNENVTTPDSVKACDMAKDMRLTPHDSQFSFSQNNTHQSEQRSERKPSSCGEELLHNRSHVMSVAEARRTLSVNASRAEFAVVCCCYALALHIDNLEVGAAISTGIDAVFAQRLVQCDAHGVWSYKAGTLLLHDEGSREAVVPVHVPSNVMERVMCNIPAAAIVEELETSRHSPSNIGWAQAVVNIFQSLQGQQTPPLNIHLQQLRGDQHSKETLVLQHISVSEEFIVHS